MLSFEETKQLLLESNRTTATLALKLLNLIELENLPLPTIEFQHYNQEITLSFDFKEEETHIELSIDDTIDLYTYFVKTKQRTFGKDDLELDELDVDLVRTIKNLI